MVEDMDIDGTDKNAVHAATSPGPDTSGDAAVATTTTATSNTTATTNPNTPESKQYYAIGFGSNYFHPFGDSAISLNDIYAHVPATATATATSLQSGMEGLATASSADESINHNHSVSQKGSFDTNMNTNTNTNTNVNVNADMYDGSNNGNNNQQYHPQNQQQQSFIFPSAFVFPLHPEQNSSTVNTNAAKQQTRSFLRFLRRKRKHTQKKPQPQEPSSSSSSSKKNNSTSASASDNVIQQALASIASSDKAFELPYAFHKKPAEQLAAGMTHVAFISKHDEASSNSYKHSHGIYMTGTLHGVTYPHPTLKQAHAKIPLRCTQIACGRRHTLAVFEGKVTMSWGSGYFGQLGHGLDHVYCHEPTVIERLMPRYLGGEVVAVAAGGMQSAVIVAADSNSQNHLNASTFQNRQNFKDVTTRVFRFGSNKHGQCAVEGGKCNSLPYPTIMMDVYHPDTGKRVSFVSLALGKLHSVGLTHHGELYSWGSTASGRCGHGDLGGSASTVRSALKLRNGVSLPKRIEALRNVKVVDVSAGDAHTLALSGSGRVFSWGNNASGQLGVGHSMHLISPRLIADLEFGQIARGFAKGELSEAASAESQSQLHSSSRDQGSSSDIGMDHVGHLGAALAPIHYPSSPQKKATQRVGGSDPVPPRICSIHASGAYSAAVSTTGDIYSWGCGDGNQLGHSHSGPGPVPDLPNAERMSVPRTGIGQRIRDVKSFDSKLNVLLPRRVDCLRHFGLKAESLVTSSNFMLAICSKLDMDKDSSAEDEESYLMGRTLYELENDRRERGLDRIRLLRGVQSQDIDEN